MCQPVRKHDVVVKLDIYVRMRTHRTTSQRAQLGSSSCTYATSLLQHSRGRSPMQDYLMLFNHRDGIECYFLVYINVYMPKGRVIN